jgi:hypothetical protein
MPLMTSPRRTWTSAFALAALLVPAGAQAAPEHSTALVDWAAPTPANGTVLAVPVDS